MFGSSPLQFLFIYSCFASNLASDLRDNLRVNAQYLTIEPGDYIEPLCSWN